MAEEKYNWGNWFWAMGSMAISSPLFFYFLDQGKAGTGRAAWICAGIYLIVIKLRWELKGHLWFWLTWGSLLALHIPLILYVHWTSRWIPAQAMLPIAVLDIAVLYGCLAVVARFTRGVPDTAESATHDPPAPESR